MTVAVIADAHLHHPDAWGLPFPALRPWADTLAAARGVNESLPAFAAVLAAIRTRGIRHVVLLGDYADDGQQANLAATAALLDAQTDLTFHLLPGNHDGWGMAGKHSATRFGTTAVTSDPARAAPDTIVTDAARIPGLTAALAPFARHMAGERPFPAFTATSADGSVTADFPECSRLVIPERGLWLLLLDANVFEPAGRHIAATRKRGLLDPATAGWAATLRQKPHLMEWVAQVSSDAAAAGATLVALSHYPALDPFGDLAHRRAVLGDCRDTRVIPPRGIAPVLAAAGISHILTGHLHCAGTTRDSGLTQHAVPSTCAWPAGFALLHPGPRVEWVSLADTPIPLSADYPEGTPRTLGPFLAAQARARFARRRPPGWTDPALADAELLRQAGPLARDALSPAQIARIRDLRIDDPAIVHHLAGIPPALARLRFDEPG
jgi:3',5'-cyclic AMP phosphodiesterase CpdA